MNKQLLPTITGIALALFSFLLEAAPWPVGNTDTLEVKKNETVTIHVLANDIGNNLKVLSVDSWTSNGGQTITNNSKTAISYTAPNTVGNDSFWYDLIDSEGQSDYAVVNITVIDKPTKPPVNSWPVAAPDSASTSKNQSVKVNVLKNDIGNGLTISELDTWTDMGGRVKLNAAKKVITYTPASGFTGVDKFWYGLVDNQNRDDYTEATITVSSRPPNSEKLSAKSDIVSLVKNKTISIPVLKNDTGKDLKIKSIDNSSKNGGTLTLNSSKTFVNYQPVSNFTGTDTFRYEIIDASNNTDSAEVKITVTENGKTRFSHVHMHYDLLNNQAMIWGELGSKPPYYSLIHNIPLTQSAGEGSTSLTVQNNAELVKNQLIIYLAINGNYYVGQIKQLSNTNKITLMEPLKSSVSSGNNVWNFYANPSHPNKYGYRAIVDFAINSLHDLHFGTNTQEKHLLLGDSWFENNGNDYFSSRLRQKLAGSTVLNMGVGGDTTHDLINRFDSDVTPNNPDYIWINSGTNDYWEGVSTAQYKANLNTLIIKAKEIGAKVIIIDSSVGEGVGATGVENQLQSEEYANAVLELNLSQ